MDGFHLAQEVLDRAGTASRKGAPFTFDGAGFVALLHRIRAMQPGATVYAPRFDRAIENPIAGAIPITAAHRLVVIEGNYLLLDEPPWDEVRELLTACLYVEIDAAVRVARLIARHIEFGKSADHATRHVMQSDEANARLIEATRSRADAVLALPA
jgi:pantothenate kinase